MKRILKVTVLAALFTSISCTASQYSAESDEFLSLTIKERRVQILKYSYSQQVELYLDALINKHPPDLALAEVLGRQGEALLPALNAMMEKEDQDISIVYLLDVYLRMSDNSYYQVNHDEKLMKLLTSKVEMITDQHWKEMGEKMLEDIKG